MTRQRFQRAALVALSIGALGALPRLARAQEAAPAAASTQDEGLEEIVVFGRSLELVGTAEAASEGTVGGADLLVRPMLRVAELLESVPGMVAVQHSGSGKAKSPSRSIVPLVDWGRIATPRSRLTMTAIDSIAFNSNRSRGVMPTRRR